MSLIERLKQGSELKSTMSKSNTYDVPLIRK